jgi:hypothetical protein
VPACSTASQPTELRAPVRFARAGARSNASSSEIISNNLKALLMQRDLNAER